MAVVDAMLVLFAQPGHRLHDLIVVPHLDHIGMYPRFERVSHQLCGHGVSAMRHTNRAPPSYHGVVDRVARDRRRRQGAEDGPLFRDPRGRGPIAPIGDHVLDEDLVRGAVRERRMAAHDQRLRDERLQTAMRLLGDAVFVGASRRDAARAHAVMIEDRAKARRERATAAGFQLVGGGREIVAPHHVRHPAQRPERALHASDERLERLAERHHHPRPVAVAQYPLKEQMRKRLTGDRHAQVGGVGEIDRGLAPRHGHLLEEHLRLDAVSRAPVAKTALERARLPRMKLLRVPRPQQLQHQLRFEHTLGIALQQRLDVGQPHRRKRIRTGPPIASLFGRRRDRPRLPLTRGPHAHAARGSRRRLGLAIHTLPPHESNLRIRDHGHRLACPTGRPEAADLIVATRQI